MDSKRINKLLEKFWECETSLEEERELKEYFLNNPNDSEFKEAGYLFRFYNNEKDQKLPDHFFSDDQWVPEEIIETNKSSGVYSLSFVWKVAAIIVVGLSAGFFGGRWIIDNKIEQTPMVLQTDTYKTPEEAYEETMKALMLISQHLNTGKEQTMKLAVFNEAERTIEGGIIN